MAFDETVLLTLDDGLVVPISHVTSNYSPSNVIVYDGEVYRDIIDAAFMGEPLGVAITSGAALINDATSPPTGALADAILDSGGVAQTTSYSDNVTHIPPRYKGKQATLWSFARTINGSAAFTHVAWASEVRCTSSHAPWRIGMTPSITIADP